MAISLVHATPANSTSVTIPSTTAGNCLLVLVASAGSSSASTLTGVTLGGAAGNFASLTAAHGTNSITSWRDAFAWADPSCAGGQTAVALAGSLNVASGSGGVTVLEFSGVVGASPLDKSSIGSSGASTTYTSGTTATTTNAVEAWAGIVSATSPVAPGGSWLDESPAGGAVAAGYQLVTSTGTATYNGTCSSNPYAALVVTLLGAPVSASKILGINQAVMRSALW